MKRILLALLLISQVAIAQKNIGIRSTTGASSNYGELWAEDNGVSPSNSASANTAAINTFLTLCETQNKKARIGSGTFNFAGTIRKPANVDFEGAGAGRTILKSTLADTLFTMDEGFTVYTVDVPEVRRNGNVKGIEFNGNSIGTIGFHVYKQVNLYFEDLSFTNFTGTAAWSNASIYIEWRNCRFMYSPVGLLCDPGTGGTLPDGTMMGNNTIKFYNCDFWECSTWGVNWLKGAQAQFYGCVIERCGTNSDAATGGAKFLNVSSGAEGVAIMFVGMWMEANSGTNLWIEGTGVTTHTIRDFICQFDGGFGHTSSRGIYVKGANTKLDIQNSTILVTGTDLVLDGARVTIDFNTNYGTYSETNSGVLYAYTPTAVSGEDVTAPTLSSATISNSTPAVVDLVYNESLLTTPLPATGDFTLSGGKTVSSVGISGSTVSVTANSAYSSGDVVTISYTGGTNKIKDLAGNIAANLSSQAVTNNISGSGAPTSGLLAYWDFEEANFSNFTDKSGNSKDFARTNNAERATGKVDNAVWFQSAFSQKLTSTSGSGLSAGTGLTIAGWVNLGTGAVQSLMQKGVTGSGTAEYGMFYYDNALSFFTSSDGTGTGYVEVGAAYTLSSGWHFFACTWNGSTMGISIDNGTPVTISQSSIHTGTATLSLGADAGGNYVNGYVDQLRIYNRALSSGEITTLYNSGTGL